MSKRVVLFLALALLWGCEQRENSAVVLHNDVRGEDDTQTVSYEERSDGDTDAIRAAPSVDAVFARRAARDGAATVELSQLAIQRAESPRVQQFAQHVVDNHGKANGELERVARRERIAIRFELATPARTAKSELSGLSGGVFDRRYIEQMVQDHQRAIEEYEREARGGTISLLRDLAESTLPTLREHLSAAQDLAREHGAANP
jgi:putative membrane protein